MFEMSIIMFELIVVCDDTTKKGWVYYFSS